MIVCICNAVREKQLRAVAGQCRTPCQAYDALGCRPKCGQCVSAARAILEDQRAAA
jgi:bacterioferritin-associated ferredoxin